MSEEKKLVLIDGHALAYRAYHALPDDLTTSNGELTNAVYGFTSMLLSVLEEERPSHIAVTFDKGRTFRHEIYAEYKAHRAKMPDELRSQMDRIRRVVQVLDIPIYEREGYEADDLLGSLARQAEDKGIETLIVTGDMDLLQLVSEHTRVLTSRWRFSDTVIYDVQKVEERYDGLEPHQLVDYKAMMGDKSDNIPGVYGVGEKTATKLLKKYESLDQIYAHIDDVSGRFRSRLQEERAQAFLSRQLARIDREAPVTLGLDACEVRTFDYEEVLDLFHELEFKSLIDRLPEPRSLQPPGVAHQLKLFSEGEEPLEQNESEGSDVAQYEIVTHLEG
ncbi:MAG: 5'-3' exonuclease, partial [Chloroflexota bacterium]